MNSAPAELPGISKKGPPRLGVYERAALADAENRLGILQEGRTKGWERDPPPETLDALLSVIGFIAAQREKLRGYGPGGVRALLIQLAAHALDHAARLERYEDKRGR